ncbi:MAG TPA: NAD(P)(+) transhydrogenase (Re/Si-specific) subunit beta [Candidatus Dormibacteraeota bacterium]|nr:NAD(P)(+) transhydrogenase (Re/Si-specific) subunit beta [Candidatus Dormibacteraeota bacterium]
MTSEIEVSLYIFLLAGFLGYHIITKVPPLLHTPLMSATNAIAAISLVGSLVVAGSDYSDVTNGWVCTMLGFIAVSCSATNAFGGFLITDRMLRMFKTAEEQKGAKRRPVELQATLAAATAVSVLILGILVAKPAGLGFVEYLREHAADEVLRYAYILSAAMFILGLKGLSSPKFARAGMLLAAYGMALAVIGTLFHSHIVNYTWIAIGMVIGATAGGWMGLRIPMTAVPQRTALSHSLGALAACLVGVSEYFRFQGGLSRVTLTALGFEVVVGGLTFTGSLMAAGKLQELLPGRPITYRGQNIINLSLMGLIVSIAGYLVISQAATPLFYLMVAMAFVFGLLLVIPIGAADMPVVIALLNSYGGLADAAMGFVLFNKIQIVTGSLDGTSGFLLSLLMCRAMNRSATNVLFGAFGAVTSEDAAAAAAEAKGSVRSITADETAVLFETSGKVIIVPGYGMAVAQAQHAVAELASILGERGIDVRYAIHPVAGRMPGHMNVLLAEANVPYEQLVEMEQINPYFPEADIVLVVGANDVTNPAARTNKASPLYGMPILDVEKAKSIIVLKRSMRPGFAGVDNELYYNERCMMLFGDAKDSITKLISELKSLL